MNVMFRSLTIYLISAAMTACIHRAPTLKMLESRADYEGKEQAEADRLTLSDGQPMREIRDGIPVRTSPKIAHIWIFPHETPAKEYFWGGWISVVVEGDKWSVESPGEVPPGKTEAASPSKPKRRGPVGG